MSVQVQQPVKSQAERSYPPPRNKRYQDNYRKNSPREYERDRHRDGYSRQNGYSSRHSRYGVPEYVEPPELHTRLDGKAKALLSQSQYRKLFELLDFPIEICSKDKELTIKLTPRELLKALLHSLNDRNLRVHAQGCRLVGSGAAAVLADGEIDMTPGAHVNDLDFTLYLSQAPCNFLDGYPRLYHILEAEEETLAYFVQQQLQVRLTAKEVYDRFFLDSMKVQSDDPAEPQEAWSLVTFGTPGQHTIDVKFSYASRRSWAFSVDSFEIVLDYALHNPRPDLGFPLYPPMLGCFPFSHVFLERLPPNGTISPLTLPSPTGSPAPSDDGTPTSSGAVTPNGFYPGGAEYASDSDSASWDGVTFVPVPNGYHYPPAADAASRPAAATRSAPASEPADAAQAVPTSRGHPPANASQPATAAAAPLPNGDVHAPRHSRKPSQGGAPGRSEPARPESSRVEPPAAAARGAPSAKPGGASDATVIAPQPLRPSSTKEPPAWMPVARAPSPAVVDKQQQPVRAASPSIPARVPSPSVARPASPLLSAWANGKPSEAVITPPSSQVPGSAPRKPVSSASEPRTAPSASASAAPGGALRASEAPRPTPESPRSDVRPLAKSASAPPTPPQSPSKPGRLSYAEMASRATRSRPPGPPPGLAAHATHPQPSAAVGAAVAATAAPSTRKKSVPEPEGSSEDSEDGTSSDISDSSDQSVDDVVAAAAAALSGASRGPPPPVQIRGAPVAAASSQRCRPAELPSVPIAVPVALAAGGPSTPSGGSPGDTEAPPGSQPPSPRPDQCPPPLASSVVTPAAAASQRSAATGPAPSVGCTDAPSGLPRSSSQALAAMVSPPERGAEPLAAAVPSERLPSAAPPAQQRFPPGSLPPADHVVPAAAVCREPPRLPSDPGRHPTDAHWEHSALSSLRLERPPALPRSSSLPELPVPTPAALPGASAAVNVPVASASAPASSPATAASSSPPRFPARPGLGRAHSRSSLVGLAPAVSAPLSAADYHNGPILPAQTPGSLASSGPPFASPAAAPVFTTGLHASMSLPTVLPPPGFPPMTSSATSHPVGLPANSAWNAPPRTVLAPPPPVALAVPPAPAVVVPVAPPPPPHVDPLPARRADAPVAPAKAAADHRPVDEVSPSAAASAAAAADASVPVPTPAVAAASPVSPTAAAASAAVGPPPTAAAAAPAVSAPSSVAPKNPTATFQPAVPAPVPAPAAVHAAGAAYAGGPHPARFESGPGRLAPSSAEEPRAARHSVEPPVVHQPAPHVPSLRNSLPAALSAALPAALLSALPMHFGAGSAGGQGAFGDHANGYARRPGGPSAMSQFRPVMSMDLMHGHPYGSSVASGPSSGDLLAYTHPVAYFPNAQLAQTLGVYHGKNGYVPPRLPTSSSLERLNELAADHDPVRIREAHGSSFDGSRHPPPGLEAFPDAVGADLAGRKMPPPGFEHVAPAAAGPLSPGSVPVSPSGLPPLPPFPLVVPMPVSAGPSSAPVSPRAGAAVPPVASLPTELAAAVAGMSYFPELPLRPFTYLTPWGTFPSPVCTPIVAESLYGNFAEAMRHMREQVLATRQPEDIRRGMFRYCYELAKGRKPASPEDRASMEGAFVKTFLEEFAVGFGSVFEDALRRFLDKRRQHAAACLEQMLLIFRDAVEANERLGPYLAALERLRPLYTKGDA